MGGAEIFEIKLGENDIEISDLAAINSLLKQLSEKAMDIDLTRIQEVMEIGTIITLRDCSQDGKLIGIASLIPVKKLISHCGTVEDVVIDKNYRGQGLGKKIMHSIIKKAELSGMKHVDLTSNAQRIEANGLYQAIGFEKRETNVYRFRIG